MRYSPRVSILRRCFATHYILAFVFSLTLAGAATLLFYVSIARLPLESKATPDGHGVLAAAETLHSKSAAGKRHDEARSRRNPGRVEKEEFQPGEADDPDARLNWFWFQRTYPFNEIPVGGRRQAWETLPLHDKTAGFREILGAESTTWSPIGPAPTTSAFPNNGGATSGRI